MLEFLEENIDEKHCAEVEKRHLDALNFKPDAVLPLVVIAKTGETMYPRDQAFYNHEMMLYNELIECEPQLSCLYNSVYIKDDFPLHIRSSHGIALTHSILGGEFRINADSLPWVIHVEKPIKEYRKNWKINQMI
jgi:hypothetical protein